MKLITVIACTILIYACQGGEEQFSETARPTDGRHQHVQNMMKQINNDLKIFAGEKANFSFKIDGNLVSQEIFEKQDRDSLVHIVHHTAEYEDHTHGNITNRFKITFSAFSTDYAAKYQFEPQYFKLHFDEAGLLNMIIDHAERGSLTSYGYDKATGNKMVEYNDISYNKHFNESEKIHYRNAETMRMILMINDSIYIHDYSLPQILQHDH